MSVYIICVVEVPLLSSHICRDKRSSSSPSPSLCHHQQCFALRTPPSISHLAMIYYARDNSVPIRFDIGHQPRHGRGVPRSPAIGPHGRGELTGRLTTHPWVEIGVVTFSPMITGEVLPIMMNALLRVPYVFCLRRITPRILTASTAGNASFGRGPSVGVGLPSR